MGNVYEKDFNDIFKTAVKRNLSILNKLYTIDIRICLTLQTIAK